VNSNHVAICSGLAAVCNAKCLPASVLVETVTYLLTDNGRSMISDIAK